MGIKTSSSFVLYRLDYMYKYTPVDRAAGASCLRAEPDKCVLNQIARWGQADYCSADLAEDRLAEGAE